MPLHANGVQESIREGGTFCAVIHELVCFIQGDNPTDVWRLLKKETETDAKEGASNFGSDAWAGEVDNRQLARLFRKNASLVTLSMINTQREHGCLIPWETRYFLLQYLAHTWMISLPWGIASGTVDFSYQAYTVAPGPEP